MPCAVIPAAGVVCSTETLPLDNARHRLGQAEVEQLGASLRQHDVAGLQIAVDDAGADAPYRARSAISTADLERLVERQRRRSSRRLSRVSPLEVLHDQVATCHGPDRCRRARRYADDRAARPRALRDRDQFAKFGVGGKRAPDSTLIATVAIEARPSQPCTPRPCRRRRGADTIS